MSVYFIGYQAEMTTSTETKKYLAPRNEFHEYKIHAIKDPSSVRSLRTTHSLNRKTTTRLHTLT